MFPRNADLKRNEMPPEPTRPLVLFDSCRTSSAALQPLHLLLACFALAGCSDAALSSDDHDSEAATSDTAPADDDTGATTADDTGEGDSTGPNGDDPAGENGGVWGGGECQDSLVPTGVDAGDVVHDLVAIDQNGSDFRLHSQCHRGVLLELSAEWCGPCKDVAQYTEEEYQRFKAQGFIPVVMLQDASLGVAAWAERFGLTHPVLDVQHDIGVAYFTSFPGWPDAKLLAPNMVVKVASIHPMEVSDTAIQGILP